MRTTRTTSAELNYNATAGDLAEWLATVPADAQIEFNTTKGDRPFDSDQHTITATWTEDTTATPTKEKS